MPANGARSKNVQKEVTEKAFPSKSFRPAAVNGYHAKRGSYDGAQTALDEIKERRLLCMASVYKAVKKLIQTSSPTTRQEQTVAGCAPITTAAAAAAAATSRILRRTAVNNGKSKKREPPACWLPTTSGRTTVRRIRRHRTKSPVHNGE